MNLKDIENCFESAKKDEERGRKHKGLLFVGVKEKRAEEYIIKAKRNLEFCSFCREMDFVYKIPEEWFYTLYYCALAILSKFGIESRSQKCTALFLRFAKNKNSIDYDDEFIDRIIVHKDKEEVSNVDEREKARYDSSIETEEILEKYNFMNEVCKKAISQSEEIIYSNKKLEIPKDIKRYFML